MKKRWWFTGLFVGIAFDRLLAKTVFFKKERELRRQEHMNSCFDKWMFLKECGVDLKSYLEANGVRRVAIYGYNVLGQHLLNQLGTEDAYVVDQAAKLFDHSGKIVVLGERTDDADLVLLMLSGGCEKIRQDIRKYYHCPVRMFQELLEEALDTVEVWNFKSSEQE